ncbi:hypothetical protein N7495_006828 [Penicillium taxi]|uniref:uncharacterized protein n=1 Tax=Penicillium taxi TaxID=168475 RepID=UPI002545AEEA|nr:uncharacterized protein N7495_006828 [Penicillium taxi]KAJ5895137.1 hypothetical protein N7495_006828 [Penicillium taxi]
MTRQHEAAILAASGAPLTIIQRETPEPGPDEYLIEVKAVAVNPVDYAQRDLGMPPISSYPACIGSDVAGIVAKIGAEVPAGSPKVGDRVLALATSFYSANPDHGAFQKFTIASSQCVVLLPSSIPFEAGAILPLATLTALSGWTSIGIPLNTKYTPGEKQAVLIWGGASNVGTVTIQSAKSMGFIVYTTASEKNHAYLSTLGADRSFDYKSEDVVAQIVAAAKTDGVNLTIAYCCAVQTLGLILDVLKETKGDSTAKVAHAPPLLPGSPTLDGVDVTFVLPPMEPAGRLQHMYNCFRVWLQQGLNTGSITPSPNSEIVGEGFSSVSDAIDLIKAGVSRKKLVVKV